ncbi:hypothetical protein MRY87_08760 [bacterium]|nr:hypothetical protein [bacterium]
MPSTRAPSMILSRLGIVRSLGLFSLFLAVFIGTLFLGLEGSSFLREQSADSLPKSEEIEEFHASAPIRTAGDFISVSHHSALESRSGQDFFLFSWIKLRRNLKDGEEAIFLAKIEGNRSAAHGYSLGLVRRGNIVRPTFYWRDSAGRGQSFLFSEIEVFPKRWILLAVEIRKNQRLSLFSGQIDPLGAVQEIFHGSYELEEEVIPSNTAPLFIGSRRTGNFRGEIGPFGIFRGEQLSERFVQLRNHLKSVELALPDELPPEDVMLFVPETEEDLSPFHHPIRIRGIGEFVSKKERKSEENV